MKIKAIRMKADHNYNKLERLTAQALKNLNTLRAVAKKHAGGKPFTHCRIVLPAIGNTPIDLKEDYRRVREYHQALKDSPMGKGESLKAAYPEDVNIIRTVVQYAFTGQYYVTFYNEDSKATDRKAMRSQNLLFNPVSRAVPTPATATLSVTTAKHLAAVELGLATQDIEENLICYCLNSEEGLWKYTLREGHNPSRLSPYRGGIVQNVQRAITPFWRETVRVRAVSYPSKENIETMYNFRVERIKLQATPLYAKELYAVIPDAGVRLHLRTGSQGSEPLRDIEVIEQTLRIANLKGTFEVLFVEGDLHTVISIEHMQF